MSAPLEISRELLAQAVDQSHDGITIADATLDDFPLIYVNAGFEHMTGYSSAELLGKSMRILQGSDTDQDEVAVLREALHQGNNCQVTLLNYRKDGSMFWNDLSISAIRDSTGALTHFVGIQKDVTERIMPDRRLHRFAIGTPDTQHRTPVGDHFEERLDGILQTAQRSHSLLSVLMINLDRFDLFNERYGQAAGETCLRMVGERIAHSFSRASDCVARHHLNEFAVASIGDSNEGLQRHIGKLRDQIRALNIPHRDSPDGIVTICAGAVSLIPQRDTTAADLIQQAEDALHQAKRRGHDCEHIA